MKKTQISALTLSDRWHFLSSLSPFCLPGTSCPFAVVENDCQAPEKQKQPQTRGKLFQERCCGIWSSHGRKPFLRSPGFIPGYCDWRCRRTLVLFPATPNCNPINRQCCWNADESSEAPVCLWRIPTVRHEGKEMKPPRPHSLCFILLKKIHLIIRTLFIPTNDHLFNQSGEWRASGLYQISKCQKPLWRLFLPSSE